MMRTIMSVICVVIAAGAAVVTQGSANEANDALVQNQAVTTCNQRIMSKTLIALNERSTFTKATADSNIKLQQSQADFFAILLHRPPYSENRKTQSSFDYYHDLQEFLTLAKKGKVKVEQNPFPKIKDYKACVREESKNAE